MDENEFKARCRAILDKGVSDRVRENIDRIVSDALNTVNYAVILPNDVARCYGAINEGNIRDDCLECLRRTSPPHNDLQVYMMQPPDFVLFCEYRISVTKPVSVANFVKPGGKNV